MTASTERRRSPSGLRHGAPPGRALATLACLALLAGVGCASSRSPSLRISDLGWPADAPRVRLERVLEPQGARTGRLFRLLAGQPEAPLLERPYGVAWDGGDLLLTDPGAGRVLRISTGGRVLASSKAELSSPIGIASCSRGIVVTDSERGEVLLLGEDLRVRERLAEGLLRPTGVACSADEIFVAETGGHRIRVLSESGERFLGTRGSEPGELNFPTSLVLDGDDLWIGDTLNFRVQRIDAATGAPRGAFGQLGDMAGEMPRLKGLAIDGAGQLWVADAHLDAISMFRRDGTYLMTVGSTGAAPGSFSFPAGVAANAGGELAVVDSFNRRIQIFRLVAPGTDQS